MSKETYEMDMYCQNCGHEWVKAFLKGIPCTGFHQCPRCDCRDGKTK
jgi:hypothetical protein